MSISFPRMDLFQVRTFQTQYHNEQTDEGWPNNWNAFSSKKLSMKMKWKLNLHYRNLLYFCRCVSSIFLLPFLLNIGGFLALSTWTFWAFSYNFTISTKYWTFLNTYKNVLCGNGLLIYFWIVLMLWL